MRIDKIKARQKAIYTRSQIYHELIEKCRDKEGYVYDDVLVRLITAKGGKPKLLDVGAGTGYYVSKALEFGASPTGVDISFYACQIAKNRNQFLNISQSDAETLPFKRDTFDIVLCLQLLEHTPYPEKVIAEIYRVLKRNGYLFLSAPNFLGSNFVTMLARIARGKFSEEIKEIRSVSEDIVYRWSIASSADQIRDLDACNKTNVFHAFNLLKCHSFRIVHCDTLRHPRKYTPRKYKLAQLRNKLPILKYLGPNYKIVAQKCCC